MKAWKNCHGSPSQQLSGIVVFNCCDETQEKDFKKTECLKKKKKRSWGFRPPKIPLMAIKWPILYSFKFNLCLWILNYSLIVVSDIKLWNHLKRQEMIQHSFRVLLPTGFLLICASCFVVSPSNMISWQKGISGHCAVYFHLSHHNI